MQAWLTVLVDSFFLVAAVKFLIIIILQRDVSQLTYRQCTIQSQSASARRRILSKALRTRPVTKRSFLCNVAK